MKGWQIVLIVLLILAIFVVAPMATYNGLVAKEQQYRAGGALYGSAMDLCSKKIELVWGVYQTYLNQEQTITAKWVEARTAFYRAASEGDIKKTIDTATNLQIIAVAEAYPLLSSVPVAQQSIGELTEAVNEIKTALDDWIYRTQNYNSARKYWPGVWVGNIFGLPGEFQYYQSDQAKLDISEIPGLDLG